MSAETDTCARMACHHSRKAHAFGTCSEIRELHNEHLFGLDQPLILKVCGCDWSEPLTHLRAVKDNPQA